MSRLIGLGGRLRAGKDVVADYLVEAHSFVKLGMSDPLLRAALVLDPVVYPTSGLSGMVRPERLSELVHRVGYVDAKKNPEVRRFLQVLGTDFGRNMIGENVWVDIARRTIVEHAEAGRDVVITGLRFPNETDMVFGLGGLTWWIERPFPPGTTHSETSAAAHASENGVSAHYFDEVLDNDSTLDDLYALIERSLP